MDWEQVSLATIGFALYCLVLILKSTSLRHLRFARLVDVAQIRNVAHRYRVGLEYGALTLSLVLMGAALWQTLNTDRSSFWLLASLAGMLIVVRLLGFFFTRVSLIVIEIETDPASRLNFAHLRRSPFILGGLFLLGTLVAIPFTIDRLVQARFDAFHQQEWQALEATAAREAFAQNYIPRSLRMKGRAQFETEFFARALLPGRRVVILGRAGVGKSWFLTQLRFWFHHQRPETVVILLNARDLQPGEDLAGHVGHTLAGGLAWGARPLTRQVMTRALVLIDGLDEVHSLNRDEVTRTVAAFIEDPANAQAIVVLTTRPTSLQPLLKAGFEVAEFPALTARESETVLKNPDRLSKLAATLHARLAAGETVNQSVLHLLAPGGLPDLATATPDQVGRLYRNFLDRFGFSLRLVDLQGENARLPFLSTYRDLDIVEELFVTTLAAQAPPAQTPTDLQNELLERFVRRRIELNYQAAPEAAGFPQRVIDALVQECAETLREAPQTRTFRFDRRRFERVFDGTTLDKVVLESELLVEQPDGLHLGFDNPVLDHFFAVRVHRTASKSGGSGHP